MVLGHPKISVKIQTRGPDEKLTINNGLNRGVWGEVDLCPKGTTVSTFDFKVSIKRSFFF